MHDTCTIHGIRILITNPPKLDNKPHVTRCFRASGTSDFMASPHSTSARVRCGRQREGIEDGHYGMVASEFTWRLRGGRVDTTTTTRQSERERESGLDLQGYKLSRSKKSLLKRVRGDALSVHYDAPIW